MNAEMIIEMLATPQANQITGIGRYMDNLNNHMPANVNIHRVAPKYAPMSSTLTFLKNLPVGLRDHTPGNVIHFPQIMGCGMLLWSDLQPTVATVHDLGSIILPTEWKHLDPIARQVLRISLIGLRRCNRILCDSEFTRQAVINRLKYPADRVKTIHLAVDHSIFHPVPGARQKLQECNESLAKSSGQWLLYVGSELPRKNIPLLLEIVANLRDRHPEVHLLKVGAAGGLSYRKNTIKLIQNLGISDHVSFFDHVSDQELALFYSSADVVLQPSRLEGFSLPALEALACGTPLICSNAGALPEVVKSAALLIDPNNEDGWINAIELILSDQTLRQQYSQAGQVQASQFSWENTAQQTVEVYEEFSTL